MLLKELSHHSRKPDETSFFRSQLKYQLNMRSVSQVVEQPAIKTACAETLASGWNVFAQWRRGWDSNSRYSRTHAFQACTLSHSVTSPLRCLPAKCEHLCKLCDQIYQSKSTIVKKKKHDSLYFRRLAKKSLRRRLHCSARIPPVTSIIWLLRPSLPIWYWESSAPVFGSTAP